MLINELFNFQYKCSTLKPSTLPFPCDSFRQNQKQITLRIAFICQLQTFSEENLLKKVKPNAYGNLRYFNIPYF